MRQVQRRFCSDELNILVQQDDSTDGHVIGRVRLVIRPAIVRDGLELLISLGMPRGTAEPRHGPVRIRDVAGGPGGHPLCQPRPNDRLGRVRRHDGQPRAGIVGQGIERTPTSLGQVRAVVADIDWQQARLAWTDASPRWAHLLPAKGEGGSSHEHPEQFRQLVVAASGDQQAKLLTGRLSEHLALVLGSSVAKIDPERSTADLGLDSLMAMEFRLRIEKDLGIDIPVMQLMQARSLTDLASCLVEQLTGTTVSGQEVIPR